MSSLEDLLIDTFVKLGVSQSNQDSICDFLDLLHRKDVATYEHSIRVGLVLSSVLEYQKLDVKVGLFAGCLHDVGKLLIPPEVLRKTEGFNDCDRKLMRKHPEYTYLLLRGIHEFSAEVALLHHKFQKEGYPKILPDSQINFSETSKVMIDWYARLLSVVDCYDAAKTRLNNYSGELRMLSSAKVKEQLLSKNPDLKDLIIDLYAKKIFE